jgi:two-component system, sensor histidine kinase and response regulator
MTTNNNHSEKATILVVDDNPGNLGVLFDYLDSAGFKVLLVQSGQNALKQAERKQPDIILLDIIMPQMDGFETCQRLKENPATRDIPVIFMTALSDTENKVKGFRLGAVDYITKPFQQEEVSAQVHTHLTIRRLQQQLEAKNTLLEEQVKELQQLNASKDTFLSMISHDLQSPFSSLRGLIQLTAENLNGYSKPELENVMDLLENSTDNLHALIENLLTWSRIQRGVIEHYPQYMDLREAVTQNLELIAQAAEKKQITLKNAIEEECRVYADMNMVNAILRNLLSNAVKFTESGGVVTVSARQTSQWLEVSISDTGIGIAEEHIKKLFRIDARYKRLGTAHEKGTGMGLILCKEFVEKHGGAIWIESQAGQGSTFRFTLPTRPSAIETPAATPGASPQPAPPGPSTS